MTLLNRYRFGVNGHSGREGGEAVIETVKNEGEGKEPGVETKSKEPHKERQG